MVEHWYRPCTVCARVKGSQRRTRAAMRQYNTGSLFKRIAIDGAGPFPDSDYGNWYKFVAMDFFSIWPEAYTLPSQDAETVVEALIENWIVISVCNYNYTQTNGEIWSPMY